MGFLNGAFGLGSFIMGDAGGGLLIGGLYLVGYIAIYAFGVTEVEDDYYGYTTYETNTAAYLIGGASIIAAVIVGFVRPFSYDKKLAEKNGTYYAATSNPMNNISLVPVSSSSGMGMGVFYSASF